MGNHWFEGEISREIPVEWEIPSGKSGRFPEIPPPGAPSWPQTWRPALVPRLAATRPAPRRLVGIREKNVGKNRVISPRNGDFMEFGWDFTKRNDDFMGFEWDFTKRNGDFMGFTQGWVGNSIVLSRKICEFTDFIKKQLGNE